ncbi:hypothetical protein Tco_0965207 [Tanacetum coccineum]
MSRSLMEWFQAESLNGVNFLDWESRLRTLLTVANDLEFIDGPWPQRPNLRVEHPSQIKFDVRKFSRGREIVRIIVKLISPNLTDGLECLTSLTIRAQHKIYAFMDMWTVMKMVCSGKVDRIDSNVFSVSLRQYAMDGYASGPDEEGMHYSSSIYFLDSRFRVMELTFLKCAGARGKECG